MSERKPGEPTDEAVGERNYPLPLAEGALLDDRFASVVDQVAQLIKEHGFEDVSPERRGALEKMLLQFMYGVRR